MSRGRVWGVTHCSVLPGGDGPGGGPASQRLLSSLSLVGVWLSL